MAALQWDEELLAQVLYPWLEAVVEQKNRDIDEQQEVQINKSLQEIQIPHQCDGQGSKPSLSSGMQVVVCAVRPTAASPSRMRKQGKSTNVLSLVV